ncbi:hypothetical protein C8Q80DRAFT_1141470 [Daedaleopsis nitida]|nr:hypothetical protein C8Q80DRAFT_1141470 [Daedaleopsis nitida]
MSFLRLLPLDVLRNVCSYLLVMPLCAADFEASGVQAILSLSRTCKSLQEPALDALWRTIPNVACLLYAMPRDLWIAEDVFDYMTVLGKPSTRLSLGRAPVAADFERLDFYRRRVRRILINFDCIHLPPFARNHSVTAAVLDAFAAHYPHGSLFPCLQVLHMTCASDGTTDLFRSSPVLFHPNLREVSYRSYTINLSREAELDYCNMLEALQRRSRSLKVLELESRPVRYDQLVQGSRILYGFQPLETFITDTISIDFRTLRHLATLGTLHTLRTQLPTTYDKSDLEYFRNPGEAIHFPVLHQLKLIHDRDVTVCATIIAAIRSPQLNDVDIYCRSTSVPLQHLTDLCKVIAHCPQSKTTLRRLSISIYSLGDDPQLSPISRQTFEPLLELHGLISLNVDVRHPMHIDNGLLLDMALAWRNIYRLLLGVESPHDDAVPSATLGGLLPFIFVCRDLTELGVAIRTDVLDIPPCLRGAPLGCGGVRHGLAALNVGRSKIEDPLLVAKFLSDVFQELCEVESRWPYDVDDWEDDADDVDVARILSERQFCDRWERVSELVKQFGKVRAQERTWAVEHGRGPPRAADLTGFFDLYHSLRRVE